MSKIIHIPFDEERESKMAYDFSGNNNHGKVIGGYFSVGKIGNSFKSNSVGVIKIPSRQLDINSDFTIAFFIKNNNDTSTSFDYVDDGNVVNVPLSLNKNEWNHFIVSRNNDDIIVCLNFSEIYRSSLTALSQIAIQDTDTSAGTLDGILDTELDSSVSNAQYDDLQVFNSYVPVLDIFDLYKPRKEFVGYKINAIDFSEFNVYVSESTPLDGLEMKSTDDYEFSNMNGYIPDTNRYLKERKIKLDCFVRAADQVQFSLIVNDFLRQFKEQYSNRLFIGIDENKPLIYDVYLPNKTDIKKKWRFGEMFGTFSLELVESASSKMVLAFIGTGNPRISIKSNNLINIIAEENEPFYDIDASNGKDIILNFTTEGTKYITIQNLAYNSEILYSDFITIWKNL